MNMPPASSRPHPAFTAVPTAGAYRIVNARVPADLAPAVADLAAADRFAACDIVVDDARIAMLGRPGAGSAAADLPTLDLRGGIVLPRFVDVHTHHRQGPHLAAPPRTRTAPHAGARAAVAADREAHWSADDVRARMDFSLRCAFAHGTGAIRTHLNSSGKQTAISWPVFAETARAMEGPHCAPSRRDLSRRYRSR